MMKSKMVMVENEIIVTIVKECKWNEMATKTVVLDWICEGNELPVGIIVECLDAHLQAQEDGEILEFDRELEVAQTMETMYLFCLKDYETHGCATEKEIAELVKTKNSELWVRYVAPYESVENRVCEGWSIVDGCYNVVEGVMVVEDDEIFLIKNLKKVI